MKQSLTQRGEDRRTGKDRRKNNIDDRALSGAMLILTGAMIALGIGIAIEILIGK